MRSHRTAASRISSLPRKFISGRCAINVGEAAHIDDSPSEIKKKEEKAGVGRSNYTKLSAACKNNKCSSCFATKCEHECHDLISGGRV